MYLLLFLKDVLNKASLIFAFTVFLAGSLQTSKIDFSQVAAKRTNYKLQVKKNNFMSS